MEKTYANVTTHRLVTTMQNINLSNSTNASSKPFAGVLQKADISMEATGYLFGSEVVEDGTWFETDEVVATGQHQVLGWFVETADGHRYVVADVDFNPTLPIRSASVEAAMHAKQHHIDTNPEYFNAGRSI